MKTSTYSQGSARELPVGARQWGPEYGIPFGVALLNQGSQKLCFDHLGERSGQIAKAQFLDTLSSR